jgi:hypothetical protein
MRYALILDCRASMAIVDEGSSSSRLERAKDLCRKFLKDSSEFDKTMLITAGQTADVIKGFGDNKAQGLHLLENIEPAGFLDGDAVSQAIEITQSSINDISQTHIIVFTDHAAELENLPFQIKQNLTVVNAAAKPVANAAILQSKIMPADNNMLQVSITIGYWGQNKIQGELELYADQNIPQKQSIELSGNYPPNLYATIH